MAYDYDLFVIGAGSGGTRAARIASGHGAKVGVAESFRIGGTCVIRGCVPKKILVYASRFADSFADAAAFGWTVGPTSFDWPTLVRAKEAEISRLSAIYAANLERAKVDIHRVHARVTGPNAIALADGQRLTARHILIATGGRPALHPRVEGLEHAATSNEMFDLPVFPRRLLVIGGGYIAVEFACLFQRLGAEVTVALRGANILRGFDEDMRVALRDEMSRAGVQFRFGRLPSLVRPQGEAKRVTTTDGETLDVDQILLATGREPYTMGLGLESAGVALADNGAVKVDARSTTNVPSIHAVGDVTDRIALTPVAIREGHWLADRLFGDATREVNYDAVATAVFTTPELGTVGLTEEAARARFPVVDVYKTNFRPLKATITGGSERIAMKLVVDGETDRVLGAHILGAEAGEIIQALAVAVKMGAKKADLDDTMPVHPTAAEELVTMRERSARHVR
ncbi:MAG: glutathione-disulfide reductase [Pseudomonadota bacterium]|nr:glutathione-disulfide reductase [Pseudomonadota bacterium]